MRAIQLTRFGEADVLVPHDLPTPKPGRGDVVVRVAFAGVNFADINLRKHGYPGPVPLPMTPGLEAAGVVEAVGDGVDNLRPGQRVACLAFRFGAYADYVCVSHEQVVALPDDVPTEHAAAVLLQGITAQHLMTDAGRVEPGTVVLVHAAAGGMGLLLCRWASHRGATVIGTVSTAAKAAAAREAGAAHVIRYDEEDFSAKTLALTDGRGADYIIDGIGKATFQRNLDAVATRGQITFYGWASGAPEPVEPIALMAKSVTLSGGNLGNAVRTQEMFESRAREVFAGVREGWLVPRIGEVFPLAEAANAHRALEGRLTIGKVLLDAR